MCKYVLVILYMSSVVTSRRVEEFVILAKITITRCVAIQTEVEPKIVASSNRRTTPQEDQREKKQGENFHENMKISSKVALDLFGPSR